MATKRQRRGRGRHEGISDSTIRYLLTGAWPVDDDWLDEFVTSEAEIAADWRELGADLVAEHVKAHPGTRPAGWWMFDSPEPRRRLGGTGEPFEDSFARGLPEFWESIDRADPPRFESEAAYLARHNLLSTSERRRLTPADFEPEVIAVDPEDDEGAEGDQQTLQATVSGPTEGAEDAEPIPEADGAGTATGAVVTTNTETEDR